MSSVAIITDTDASLPTEIAARYHIHQVPISVQFGSHSYDTGVDIDDSQLFARVDHGGRLPSTAAPTPGKYAEAFQAALDAGSSSVICFCVSSKVSASVQAAQTAKSLLPDADITVVNSNSLSMGQGYMVLAAAEAIAGGASKQEAIDCALDIGRRTHLFAALSTLKYLAMSGRVGYLAAGMAQLFEVKPILTIQDGKLELLERVRTQKRSWARVVELAAAAAGGRRIERMALIHSDAYLDAQHFRQQLCSSLPCPENVILAALTPGLSVHAGSGVVGVVIVADKITL